MIFYETPYYGSDTIDGDYIKHSGRKGQKWGVRQYQNEDGSLTPLGREHYGVGTGETKTKNKVSTEKQERILKNFYKKDLDEKSQKEVDRFKKQLSSVKSEAIETKKSEAKGLEEAYNKRVKEITKETPMPKKGSGPDANRIFRKELQAYYKKQTSDKTLKSLSEQYLKKRKEICGVYLNELGFEDNEKNRDRLLRMLKP